jgi:alkanesulfonate monooxygenase SsuD/methylene tetrahydromethanopterin reductase-like flavin-dependent oxidoreductase (luciferase family)
VDVSLDLGIVGREPAPNVDELCVEAEELGFGGLWVADSQAIFRDAFAILAVAAARTRRMLLSTGVTNPVTRHPSVLAGSFATLDELAPGRVVLTLGRGESAVFTIGRRPATTKRLEQSVHALRALLAGETVSWRARATHALRLLPARSRRGATPPSPPRRRPARRQRRKASAPLGEIGAWAAQAASSESSPEGATRPRLCRSSSGRRLRLGRHRARRRLRDSA